MASFEQLRDLCCDLSVPRQRGDHLRRPVPLFPGRDRRGPGLELAGRSSHFQRADREDSERPRLRPEARMGASC